MVLQFSGRLTAVTDGEKTLAEYVYSASGNPVVKKIGGNITSTYGYDELLNIKALKTETEKQTLADNHYFYDGNGNQIRREGLEGTTGYAYDGRNRLTEISYPSALGGYTEKLGYDAAGNRIRRETEQEITTYRYDNCNRLQELRREYKNAETAMAQPQIIRYTYDRQGNMLREKSMKSGEEKKYSYDSFGRMVRAEVPVESPSTREFQVQINRYDGEGLRHEMEENGRLIKFLYNEDREVVAEETSNGTITRYIRGLGLISSDSEEAKTYYHYVSDEQGSITHVLSEDAEILNHYSYDAFGNIIQKTEKVENRFCYNGEMLDPVTQQYYLRARFYNPVIGRFTQEDTYYGDGLNLYQYCQANPVGYVDPSGHNCGTTQSRYNSDEEQHPKANAAGGYTSATEKGNSKSGSTTITVSQDRLQHSVLGEFNSNRRLINGGHGQANINYLNQNNIEYNIVKVYDNGVRVGNIPSHKNKFKRTGTGQAWFPESWTEIDIKNAGEYVANIPENVNIPDGAWIFGEYNSVRVGIIKNNGEIGTIIPDNSRQP